MWSVVETCLAIVSACLPTLRPLYERFFGKEGSTTVGSSGARSGYPSSGKLGGSGGGFKMGTYGSGSAGTSYPGKSSVTESNYKEEASVHSFSRLRDDDV